MEKIIKRLYDYKLNIPSSLLKKIGIFQNNYVEIKEVEGGILICKTDETEITQPTVKAPVINSTNNLKENTIKVVQRNVINIPKSIYDKYELREKLFFTKYYLDEVTGNTVGIIELNDRGPYTFRKDNRLCISYIFPELELFPGVSFTIEKEENKIILKFDRKLKELVTEPLIEKEEIEEIKEINSQEEVEEKEELNDYYTYKCKINKRGVITIPIEAFKSCNLANKKYSHKVQEDEKCLVINFNENGNLVFPKNSAFNLKSLAKPIVVEEGNFVKIKVNQDELFIYFDENDIEVVEKEETIKEKPISIPKEIKEVKQPKLKSNNFKMENLYRRALEEFKRNRSEIRFITKEDLPDEEFCYKCNKELTEKDDSMLGEHRICKACKRTELKKWFKPLYELAKLKKEVELEK